MLAAAVQLNSTEDIDRNLATADRLVRQAAARGAELVLLPEKWTALGGGAAQAAAAQPPDGPVVAWAASLAAELGIDFIAGSFLERASSQPVAGSPAGDGRAENVCLHFGPDGRRRARYAKLHMFDVTVDGVEYRESDHDRPGDEVVVSELSGGEIVGLSICYDLRFPELYRALVDRGAEVLTVPSAFTLATTRDHWEILLRARAIENQCFVVAANQFGAAGDGRRSGGRSLIVDPWGVVLAGAHDGETAIIAELDFERLRRIRSELPALAHRRAAALFAPEGAAAR